VSGQAQEACLDDPTYGRNVDTLAATYVSDWNKGGLSTAEMEILLSFDQGQLYFFEQARDLSVSLLEEWLVKYKFKDWKTTEKLWNSHSIGISMERLRDILNIKIDDFGSDQKLSDAVRRYHGLLSDYMARMNHKSVVHTRLDYQPLM
jgi:hypothetical protein